jgi:hypothetical protein
MKKSDVNPLPQYYDRYINLVPDVELSQAFDDSIRQLDQLDRSWLSRIGDKTYSPGKWTVKDIFQHLIDAERIMGYRALMFARGTASVEGFDQEAFAENARTGRRKVNDLLDELILVRRGTKALYDSFDDDMLRARGTSWEHEISVLHIGFMFMGHQVHHLNVIKERYSSLEATGQST